MSIKRIFVLSFITIIIVFGLIINVDYTHKKESETITLSAQKINYNAPKSLHVDVDGNLLVPFDIAYPEAFSSGTVQYDTKTLLFKVITNTVGDIQKQLDQLGIASIIKVFGDEIATWYEATLLESENIHQVMKKLRSLDEVLVADYQYTYQQERLEGPSSTVNTNQSYPDIFSQLNILDNPKASEQWYLDGYGIPEAWAWMQENGYRPGGSEDVVVAVIDTGVDYLHPDLIGNMWINPNEINNNQDSDQNGYKDDIYGVNVIDDNRSSMDDHGHGTHVAGIIAASNNKEGIVGVAYNVKIMAIKAGMSSGFFSSSAIAKGIEYAYLHGADVINMSFGGSLPSIAVQEALMKAYTTSILVAAAGNNGLPNQKCFPIFQPTYPAALSYVIGVMSVGSSNVESGFSNWDCNAYNSVEYEVNAPGENILSTLPNGQYITWNGTSMAAPVVAGIAALVRSVYTDRDVYPNKFVMGQISSASETPAFSALGRPSHNIPPVVDAFAALTKLPKPDITLYDYYIYDDVSLSSKNNGDGIVDAGETIQLGIVLRNRWGKSKETLLNLDTNTALGDPLHEDQQSYITFSESSVFYGDVGTYSTKDFLRREGSIVKGIEKPFVFTVDENAPNDYILQINLRGTYLNALDPDDLTEYRIDKILNDPPKIYITIRSGEILPNRITKDMTLDNSNLYIIPNSMIIEKGATLTVLPGTKIQFWSDDPNDAYADQAIAYLRVEGNLIIEGSLEEPVLLFPSQLRDRYVVEIFESGNGFVSIKHAEITNPLLRISYLGYSNLKQNYIDRYVERYLDGGLVKENDFYRRQYEMHIRIAEYNKFDVLGFYARYDQYWWPVHLYGSYYNNIFREMNAEFHGYFESNVFLTNNNTRYYYQHGLGTGSSNAQIREVYSPFNIFTNNAHLEEHVTYYDPNTGTTYLAINHDSGYTIQALQGLEGNNLNVYIDNYIRFAESLGGNLLKVETKEELDTIKSNVLPRFNFTSNLLLFGLKYDVSEDQFIWYDGSVAATEHLDITKLDLGIDYYYAFTNNGDIHIPGFNGNSGASWLIIEIPNSPYVSDITLSDDVIELDLTSSFNINAFVEPILASDEFIYVSDDTFVVSVSEKGVVTPNSYGSAKIYVYSSDYNVHDVIEINVVERKPLESIEISLNNPQLSINQNVMLDVDFTPFNTTQRNLTYVSTNEDVATINDRGIITALAPGATTIQVSSQDGFITDEITITVVSPVTSIAFKSNVYVTNLDSTDNVEDYMPLVLPIDATNKNILWRSSNPEVAYINELNELVKLKDGVTTLVAKVENTDLETELIISISSDYVPAGISEIYQYNNYFYGLNSDGYMYYWGGSITAPKRMELPINEKIKDIAVAYLWDNILVLTESNKLYNIYLYDLLQNNRSTYLTSHYGFDINTNTSLNNIKKIVASYGSYHILLEDGSVWSWGYNQYGKLGDGTTTDRSALVQALISNVKDIEASEYSVIYLKNNGDVFASGTNNNYATPTKLYSNGLKIEANYNRNYVTIQTTTNVYSWSSALDYTITNQITFDTIHLLSSSINAYIDDGELYIKGYNNSGMLGLGNINYVSNFTKVPLPDVTKVFIFGENMFIQTEHGFYGVGRNHLNQLMTFNTVDQYLPVQMYFGLKGNDGGLLVEVDPFTKKIQDESQLEFYGTTLLFDLNEAITFGVNSPFITLKNQNGQSLGITRTIDLDKFYITPFAPLVIGQTYTIEIPKDALSTKFIIGNESLQYTFTYMGYFNPSDLTTEQGLYLEQLNAYTSNDASLDIAQPYYNGEYFVIQSKIKSIGFETEFKEMLLAYDLSLITFNNMLYNINDTSSYNQLLRAFVLSDKKVFNLSAQIINNELSNYDVSLQLNLTFDINEMSFNEIYQDYLDMEIYLISSTHPNNSKRHLVDKDIVFIFNAVLEGINFNQIRLIDSNNFEIDVNITLVDSILTINPISSLIENSDYTVFIPEGALSDNLGKGNQEIINGFKTYEPIEFIRASISDGQDDVFESQQIRFYFNHIYKVENAPQIILTDGQVSFEVTINETNESVFVTPKQPLFDNTTYTIIIPEGRYQDELGVLSNEIRISFKTLDKEERFYYNFDYVKEQFDAFIESGQFTLRFKDNVVLNNFTETNVDYWLRFTGVNQQNSQHYYNYHGVIGTYFGTDDPIIIEKHFTDFDDFQSLIDLVPYNTRFTAPENTFPFVVDVKVLNSDGEEQYSYGNEKITFVVTFNRDMDMTVPLDFRFGSSLPFAEYKIEGEYINPRTWQATYELRSFVESGNQYINIDNGHAKDNKWLTLGWDVKRFTFNYDTTEAQALAMQGISSPSGIDLSWVQDDYETIAGYNLYRSTSSEGNYTRINDSILPYDLTSFTDYNVSPGQLYYYRFSVVLTDFNNQTGTFTESEPSTPIEVRAYDSLLPTISHTPVYESFANRNMLISAMIVDNVSVTQAKVYFRIIGQNAYQSVVMNALNNRYTGVITANHITTEGIEYYIEAYDGINYQYYGSNTQPIKVTVKALINSDALGDVNADNQISVLDALLILQYINGFITLDSDQIARADLNKNGQVEALEALAILQYAIGLRGTLQID